MELWVEVLTLKELRSSEKGWFLKCRLRMLVKVFSLSWLLLLRRALKYRLSLAFSRCYLSRAYSRLYIWISINGNPSSIVLLLGCGS